MEGRRKATAVVNCYFGGGREREIADQGGHQD